MILTLITLLFVLLSIRKSHLFQQMRLQHLSLITEGYVINELIALL